MNIHANIDQLSTNPQPQLTRTTIEVLRPVCLFIDYQIIANLEQEVLIRIAELLRIDFLTREFMT